MEPNKNADWSEEWWDNNYGITGIDNGCISNKTTTTCDLSNEECEWSILAYIL